MSDFQIIWTADGSPTLEIPNEFGVREKMHHSKGALSETLFVYGEAMALTWEKTLQPHVLNVGVGVGYHEFMVAAMAVRDGRDIGSLVSFERLPQLHTELLNVITPFESTPTTPLTRVFQDVLDRVANHFQVEARHIRQKLENWRERDLWQREGTWTIDTHPKVQFHCILYDPFSAKMNPEFWTDENLSGFLQRWCATPCVFSTYAARGVLTRALKSAGFQVTKRNGFGGKKESTLAARIQATNPT